MTMPAPYPERPATALRSLEAPRGRLLPYTSTKAQITIGLSLWLDEIRGSRQRPRACLGFKTPDEVFYNETQRGSVALQI